MDYNYHDYNCVTVIALHAIISVSVQWVPAELPFNISSLGYFMFLVQNPKSLKVFVHHYQFFIKTHPLTVRQNECLHVTYMSQSSSAANM